MGGQSVGVFGAFHSREFVYAEIVDLMSAYWGDFAKAENPLPAKSKAYTVDWLLRIDVEHLRAKGYKELMRQTDLLAEE